MKRHHYVALFILLFSNTFCIAQDHIYYTNSVPKAVEDTLKALYPGVKDIRWYNNSGEHSNYYHAIFKYMIDTINLMYDVGIGTHKGNPKTTLSEPQSKSTYAYTPAFIKHKFDSIYPSAEYVSWYKARVSDANGYYEVYPQIYKDVTLSDTNTSPEYIASFYHKKTDEFWLENIVGFNAKGKLIELAEHPKDSVTMRKIEKYMYHKYPAYYDSAYFLRIIITLDNNGNQIYSVRQGFDSWLHDYPKNNTILLFKVTYRLFDLKGNYIKEYIEKDHFINRRRKRITRHYFR
jgi:hypothetical protein